MRRGRALKEAACAVNSLIVDMKGNFVDRQKRQTAQLFWDGMEISLKYIFLKIENAISHTDRDSRIVLVPTIFEIMQDGFDMTCSLSLPSDVVLMMIKSGI